MSDGMLYEDYIRQQIEHGSCGVAIIPALIANDIADWIENNRNNEITHEQAIDFLTESGWLKEHDRQMMLDGVRKLKVDGFPKGKWMVKTMPKGTMNYCSECGFGQFRTDYRTYNYCPNCGACMITKTPIDKDELAY